MPLSSPSPQWAALSRWPSSRQGGFVTAAPGHQHAHNLPAISLKLPRKMTPCTAVSERQGSCLQPLVPPSSPALSTAPPVLSTPPHPPQSVAFGFLLAPGAPEGAAKDKHPICVTAEIYAPREPGGCQDLFASHLRAAIYQGAALWAPRCAWLRFIRPDGGGK